MFGLMKYGAAFIFFSIFLWTACKTGEKINQNPVSYEELYKVWQIDSIDMTGRDVPHIPYTSTIEFTEDGKYSSTINRQTTTLNYQIRDDQIVNLDAPEQSPQIIEKLTKDFLILKSEVEDGSELRLYLSPKTEE